MAPAQLSTTGPRPVVRILPALALAAALFAGLPSAHAQAADAPPARGFIVKLKSPAGTRSSSSQRESAQSVRNRLAIVSARQRIGYLDSRPTPLDSAHVLNYGRWLTAAEAQAEAQRLRSDPDVEWVTINSIEKRMWTAPNDPGYTSPDANNSQWWIKAAGGNRGVPDIPAAWTVLEGAGSLGPVLTAVLDSGVRFDHPDLAGQVINGYDFVSEYDYANDGNTLDPDASDPGDWVSAADKRTNPNSFDSDCIEENSSWHGTHIAGQLAAKTGNGIGIAGMLWQLQAAAGNAPVVLGVRVAGKCGAPVNDIIEGMYWAAGIGYPNSPPLNPNPVRVISLSFGGNYACTPTDSGAYIAAIAKLNEAGVLVVAAAGNGAINAQGAINQTRPANCQGVLGVTAVNRDGTKAYYANLITPTVSGITTVGIATVGGDSTTASGSIYGLLSTSNDGTTVPVPYDANGAYGYTAGTSFSTPIAAGVAAMMFSINPNLSPADVRNGILQSRKAWSTTTGQPACTSVQRGHCQCDTNTCGAGILDAAAALNFARTATPSDGTLVSLLSGRTVLPAGTVNANYQTDRGSSSTRVKGSSGGGGAVQPAWLAGLALAAAVLAAGRRGGARSRA